MISSLYRMCVEPEPTEIELAVQQAEEAKF
jgi:hypothetical protein